MLRADNLHHGYGESEVLRGVDLAVDAGERVGLAGPSGSGKSTLARILALLERPRGGRVLIDGDPVMGAGLDLPPQLRRRVHMLWQAPRPAVDPRFRLRRVMAQPLRLAGARPSAVEDTVRATAERVGLTADLLDRHPNEVSDGQLQRACLARALLLRPGVLIADEPGAMLDVSTQAALLAVLAEETARGLAVVLISHDIALLQHWCGRVLDMSEGRVSERRPTG